MFASILTEGSTTFLIPELMLCTMVSIVLGFVIAFIYMYKSSYTKNFVMTLVLLPALVQIVIMLVNGNLGTSVAVLGAFGLVRFRSIPGSSKEISSIFFAMAIGLATGMGYITYAVLFTLIIGLVFFILNNTKFGEKKENNHHLKITIPDQLDYTEIFDDIFEEYTAKRQLIRVKTTNLGSMFELSYDIVLKEEEKQKKMIDAIRERNGNLPVICARPQMGMEEL